MEKELEVPNMVGAYQVGKALGSGAFATVYEAMHILTGEVVALKCIPKKKLKSQREFELLMKEVNIMKQMDHPFIASFYEFIGDEDDNVYISMEKAGNGSLLDFINKSKGLNESMAKRMFFQLVTVLQYLHVDKKIVHRDIKAENVLLDRNYNVRLVDFGLSKVFTKDDPFLQTTCGSPSYVAPEIIEEMPYTANADIWSLGVLLFAMVTGKLPFNGDNISQILEKILKVNPVIPNHLSPELKDLIKKMLTKNPDNRIKLDGILTHPWLTKTEDANQLKQDLVLIKSIKVVNTYELDNEVMNEMKVIGYDITNISNDLSNNVINERTVAYKILKRNKTIDEIKNWQVQRESKNVAKQQQPRTTPMTFLSIGGNRKGKPSIIHPRIRVNRVVP